MKRHFDLFCKPKSTRCNLSCVFRFEIIFITPPAPCASSLADGTEEISILSTKEAGICAIKDSAFVTGLPSIFIVTPFPCIDIFFVSGSTSATPKF